jgi:hypothetical protein
MAAPQETCTKEEQRSVVSFMSSEGVKPIEIYLRMKVQYGDACLSLQQVYEWNRKFRNGVSSVTLSSYLRFLVKIQSRLHHIIYNVYIYIHSLISFILCSLFRRYTVFT